MLTHVPPVVAIANGVAMMCDSEPAYFVSSPPRPVPRQSALDVSLWRVQRGVDAGLSLCPRSTRDRALRPFTRAQRHDAAHRRCAGEGALQMNATQSLNAASDFGR